MSPDSAPAVAPDSRFPPVVHVERDRHTRELVALFLGRAGFRVESAETGTLALERVRRYRRALVIAEILIPELDGLSLCRAIKGDPGLTAGVVILSVLATSQRARDAGADAFFVKPIEERLLVSTLRDLAHKVQSVETPGTS